MELTDGVTLVAVHYTSVVDKEKTAQIIASGGFLL